MRIKLNEITPTRIILALQRRISDILEAFAWLLSKDGQKAQSENVIWKDKHLGQTCVLICNGPSINETDMSLVAKKTSLCSNRSYLMFPRWGFVPTYFVASAGPVLSQFKDDICNLKMHKFLDFKSRAHYRDAKGVSFIRLPPTFQDRFTGDISKVLTGGGTVTYVMLQIAYYMGFKNVIIIGMDHRFSQKGIPNTTEVLKQDDKDHMHPNYFPAGVVWQLPDLVRSEMAYRLAREAFEKDGRRIIDATLDGACDVFEKMPLKDALEL